MRYNDANTYFKNRFGTKLYKVSLSIASTCPNRDGTCGVGGCSFCSGMGSGDFAEELQLPISEQINKGIERVSRKTNSDTRYIAYFQSFTSTHVAPEILKKALNDAASHPLVSAISIATRPDCLGDEVLGIIAKVNEKIPVFVELGLQTANDSTAEWFNRGYKSTIYADTVNKLTSMNIDVITHIILFLKGEDLSAMKRSVQYAVDCGTNGIKFTCLYILKGTRVYDEWERGEIYLPDIDEYFDTVEECLNILPPDVVVHRLTGDGPKSLLAAPMWTSNKRGVINYINKRFG